MVLGSGYLLLKYVMTSVSSDCCASFYPKQGLKMRKDLADLLHQLAPSDSVIQLRIATSSAVF